MRTDSRFRPALPVFAATAVLVALAASLAVRVAARASSEDVAAALSRAAGTERLVRVVPEPVPIDVSSLPTPECWACGSASKRPVTFEVDLDHVAPLGKGTTNAATWFASFAKPSGERASELEDRRIDVRVGEETWRVLPADDPILIEAEAWVDQATCHFYPDVWEVRDLKTPLPNLLFLMTLGKSWVARGRNAADPVTAAEDYRRAVRLGRLLRQDDVTIIQDLIGLACVRLGLVPLYETARERGDAASMAAIAILLADHGAMRQRASQHVAPLRQVWNTARFDAAGAFSLSAPDTAVETLFSMARDGSERRFVLESLFSVQLVRQFGTPDQQARALALLDELASRQDELVARRATEVRAQDLGVDDIRNFLEDFGG